MYGISSLLLFFTVLLIVTSLPTIAISITILDNTFNPVFLKNPKGFFVCWEALYEVYIFEKNVLYSVHITISQVIFVNKRNLIF